MTISIQKANFWKRFSAWMLDSVLIIFLALGFIVALFPIVNIRSLADQYTAKTEPYRAQIEAEFNIDLDMSQEDYAAMTEEARAEYNEKLEKANAALSEKLQADTEVMALQRTIMQLFISVCFVSLFLSHLILGFVLPLFLKNGQTVGKKMLGLGVMRTNAVRITPPVLFIRQLIGVFAMETAAVLYMCMLGSVGMIAALLVQLLQIGLLIKTPTSSSIHDLLSDTMVVDIASQRIFDSPEAREAYLASDTEEPIGEKDTPAEEPSFPPEQSSAEDVSPLEE